MDGAPDPRLEFLGGYIQKTMKLKSEKWSRLLATEELKAQVVDWLDQPEPPVLIVMQNAAAQLLLATSFPVSLKSKATYFIKKKRQPVPKENIGHFLVVGDMATKPIEQLATLVDEVRTFPHNSVDLPSFCKAFLRCQRYQIFVPLLSNPGNHKCWPPVVAHDVKKHVHSLKSTVYQVKGQVSGQTVLPMPVGIERVHEAEKMLLTSGGENVDLYLKSAIEGVVIKWVTQINDVLTKDSSQAFLGGQNPNPAAEIYFWNNRLKNLENIYDQLRDERVRKMAVILEKTDSAYFPCFKNLFHNIVAALTEAKDICLYLKPLIKQLTVVEETDFGDLIPQLKPLLHVVCLIWSHSRYYCNSAKIIILLKQICNMIIDQGKHYLDPSSIFQSDVDEAKQRITYTVTVFKAFRQAFDDCKETMVSFFRDRPPVHWTFHPKMVFERFENFLNRLQIIQCFFDTVQEFMKLEKVEVGGLKGRQLSSKIIAVSQEFHDHLSVFACKTYDVLDPEDETFLQDFSAFQNNIRDLDRRLASILCQAFDDCCNLESIFKLINIMGTILERPLIKEDFTGKYHRILEMLNHELNICQELYGQQMTLFNEEGVMDVYKMLPPVAGAIKWTEQLRERIKAPITAFKQVQHSIAKSPEALIAIEKAEGLIAKLLDFDGKCFKDWTETIHRKCETNLNKPLLTRKNNELALNFDTELTALLREVHYLKQLNIENIPEEALRVSDQEDTFRSYTCKLNQIIDWYNNIRRMCLKVEFDLVRDVVSEMDLEVQKGEKTLTWNSSHLEEYISYLFGLVGGLEKRVHSTQKNVTVMKNIMAAWLKYPVFERKDSKKDALLALDVRHERIQKRHSEMTAAAVEVQSLLNENMQLFGMTENQSSAYWKAYVLYIDSIVYHSVLTTVGCSMGYLAENMDHTNNLPPLFEVQLVLQEPDLVFVPKLDTNSEDGLPKIIETLIADILSMSYLIPRISKGENGKGDTYGEEIGSNADITEMQQEIRDTLSSVIEEALEFAEGFQVYSYLWLDDRESYMAQFLAYSRQLTVEEIELVANNDNMQPTLCPPKMDHFREQIDNYENLFREIEELESYQIFSGWFQIDLRPFKHALVNAVCKWSAMFKEHLVQHVTSSLAELADFIHAADEGLLQTVPEGDYDTLVDVMGYLMNVKDRKAETDEMFQPLHQTIELLKSYDQELPEEVNVLLQELPEQWNNTKKIAAAVKQQVAPLQASEVSCIRKKIQAFDVKQNQYRENFRKYSFMKYSCEKPYFVIDQTNAEIKEYENEMGKIQESASLFEVNVPEFKPLKQCRKELRMLKQLWDYVSLVQSCIDDWKTTPWRKVDVENMDIECKKFAKEIRALDKEMRVWDTYISLEATVKNMLTSLKAVGELQNPAIRDRHWKQLMSSTKSLAELPQEFTVKFVMDVKTTLADLLALNLHECEEEVKNIVDKAVKEMSMEKILRELHSTWSKMEFERELHPRTGCILLKASEELIETLEDNQVQLQNLITSKFIAHFLDDVSSWQAKLSVADQVITVWFEVQRTWMHLESIFMSSEDIRKQLPEDAERFDNIDREFKLLTEKMSKTPNVVMATNQEGLSQQLDVLQKQLTLCEKALAEYLETKRLAFPRFYFVSSADLLDVLSNGNEPDLVIKHLTKLFDSMAKLKFLKDDNKKNIAEGMHAKDGEYVQFHSECDCTGAVEVWLNRLQKSMRDSIRYYFSEAVVTYEEKPREQWLFDYPAQVSLCGTQIWWTTEVNIAFSRLEEGYENALKDYQKKQINQLSTLISLLLGELTKQDRQKIMTICTIDVHSRDVVTKLIQSKVESSNEFQWQSQLRHRWDEDEKDCFANICDAEFRYCHEYLGNTPRLVITPLTDRCYITLTQSLHLVMGGGPAGPAGTGKTETTKDLGRALGMMVYVFNCSEQMDYKSCGNIYKGLAQTGAWGCFDEFNRISVEVLSVVAVQVKSVQDAIRDKKAVFNFMGETIALCPTVGIFITMNPGYAGRTELPENLKALFRCPKITNGGKSSIVPYNRL